MALKPLNDLAKIRLDKDEFGFGGQKEDKAETGILVELPEQLLHYGFYSFAFERSLFADKGLADLLKYWQQFVGKRVYWLALSEKGAILKEGDERYAYIKLTSLIAWSDADNEAESILDDKGGSFSV